jgi:hypothetical protein
MQVPVPRAGPWRIKGLSEDGDGRIAAGRCPATTGAIIANAAATTATGAAATG